MRQNEILIERRLRVGTKELQQALTHADEFTYGFEAEFVAYAQTETSEKYTIGIDDINSVEDILKLYNPGRYDTDYKRERLITRLKEELSNQRNKFIIQQARVQAAKWARQKGYDMEELSQEEEKMVDKVQNSYISKYADTYTVESIFDDFENLMKVVRNTYDPKYEQIDFQRRNSQFAVVHRISPEQGVADRLKEQFGYDVKVTRYSQANYNKWSLVDDSTIDPDNPDEGEVGVELVSPIFQSYDEYIEAIKNVFGFIKNNGYTNASTGFHINIGFKGETPSVDLMKMQLLLGDEYLAKMFDRSANRYADQIKNIVQKYFNKTIITASDIPENKEDLMNMIERLLQHSNKYRSVNTQKFEEQGYFEFRVLGGSNYHNKIDKVEYATQRFLYGILVGVDYYIGRQEYLTRLYDLIQPQLDRKTDYDRATRKLFKAGATPDLVQHLDDLKIHKNSGAFVNSFSWWVMRIYKTLGKIPISVRDLIHNEIKTSRLGQDQKAMDIFINRLMQHLSQQEFEDLASQLKLEQFGDINYTDYLKKQRDRY